MKIFKFLILASIAVLFLSITNTNAQNFRMDYQLNLQSVTEVALAGDGSGGFLAVVTGINSSGNEIITLYKLSSTFVPVWIKSLDYSQTTFFNFCAYDVKHDDLNGGYAICGRYYDPNMVSYRGGFLMRIDDNGNMLWTLDAREIYNTDKCEELKSVEIVGNHYICCGYSIDNGQPKEGFIWSVDKNSQIVEWTKTENSNYNYPNPIVDVTLNDVVYNTYDGLLYTCGTFYDVNGVGKEFVLASYDLNGNNVISKKYTDFSTNSMVGKALAYDNQYIYVTGNVDMGGSEDIFMAKFLPNGTGMANRRLDVTTGDRVEDVVYYQNQLFYTGFTHFQLREGLIMQTWDNGLPIFSALNYGTQTPKFEFHKMLYRTTYTTPSIIKIGMHGTTNSFTIVETYIPYQQNCYGDQRTIQPYVMNLNSADVMVDHTKIDFNLFHIILPNNEQKIINLVCNSTYFLTGPSHDKNTILHTNNAMQENTDGISVQDNQISLALSYQNAAYKLYSIDGRCMASGTLTNNCNIDISSYTKGIYLLHLQSANKDIKAIKIIK
jgi:hypothetical protein